MLSPSALSQIELYLYLKVTSLIRYHVQIYRSVNRFHLGTKPELFHGHILSCSQIPLIYSNTLHPLLDLTPRHSLKLEVGIWPGGASRERANHTGLFRP